MDRRRFLLTSLARNARWASRRRRACAAEVPMRLIGLVFVLAVILAFGSLIVEAQTGKVWRIGLMHVGLDHVPPSLVPLREELRALGRRIRGTGDARRPRCQRECGRSCSLLYTRECDWASYAHCNGPTSISIPPLSVYGETKLATADGSR
jgi:hypothetical protein